MPEPIITPANEQDPKQGNVHLDPFYFGEVREVHLRALNDALNLTDTAIAGLTRHLNGDDSMPPEFLGNLQASREKLAARLPARFGAL